MLIKKLFFTFFLLQFCFAQTFQVGDKVEVLGAFRWWKAQIQSISNESVKILYIGYNNEETLDVKWIRKMKLDAATNDCYFPRSWDNKIYCLAMINYEEQLCEVIKTDGPKWLVKSVWRNEELWLTPDKLKEANTRFANEDNLKEGDFVMITATPLNEKSARQCYAKIVAIENQKYVLKLSHNYKDNQVFEHSSLKSFKNEAFGDLPKAK